MAHPTTGEEWLRVPPDVVSEILGGDQSCGGAWFDRHGNAYLDCTTLDAASRLKAIEKLEKHFMCSPVGRVADVPAHETTLLKHFLEQGFNG